MQQGNALSYVRALICISQLRRGEKKNGKKNVVVGIHPIFHKTVYANAITDIRV